MERFLGRVSPQEGWDFRWPPPNHGPWYDRWEGTTVFFPMLPVAGVTLALLLLSLRRPGRRGWWRWLGLLALQAGVLALQAADLAWLVD